MFRLFAGAFHSADAYREMRKANDFGIAYALFLVSITTFVVCVYFSIIAYIGLFTSTSTGDAAAYDSILKQMAAQVPVMTLKDGTLVTKDPQATIITLKSTSKNKDIPFVTIDTTGQTTSGNMTTPVLVTAHELITKTKTETKIHPLSDFTKDTHDTILINRAVAEDTANSLIDWTHRNLLVLFLIVGGICWLGVIMLMFMARMFMLFLLGVAGLFIGNFTKKPITYAAAVGLASLSYTPVAVVDTLLFTFFLYTPYVLTLGAAGIVMLYFGMKCSEPAPETVVG